MTDKLPTADGFPPFVVVQGDPVCGFRFYGAYDGDFDRDVFDTDAEWWITTLNRMPDAAAGEPTSVQAAVSDVVDWVDAALMGAVDDPAVRQEVLDAVEGYASKQYGA